MFDLDHEYYGDSELYEDDFDDDSELYEDDFDEVVDDEELLEMFLGGDQDAFTELTGRYRDELTRTVASRLNGDWNTAGEVVQSAFINAAMYAERFDATKTSFERWINWWVTQRFADATRKSILRLVADLTGVADYRA